MLPISQANSFTGRSIFFVQELGQSKGFSFLPFYNDFLTSHSTHKDKKNTRKMEV